MARIDRSKDIGEMIDRHGVADLSGFEDDVVDLVEAGIMWMTNQARNAASRFIESCESPIERIFAAAVFKMVGVNEMLQQWAAQVPVGKYRIDFVHTVREEGREIRVAVECDGHDFHEKTKEQAQRDKERDRFLQQEGYFVFRYTGSEVYKSPERCVMEVWRFAADKLYEGMDI